MVCACKKVPTWMGFIRMDAIRILREPAASMQLPSPAAGLEPVPSIPSCRDGVARPEQNAPRDLASSGPLPRIRP